MGTIILFGLIIFVAGLKLGQCLTRIDIKNKAKGYE